MVVGANGIDRSFDWGKLYLVLVFLRVKWRDYKIYRFLGIVYKNWIEFCLRF